MRKATYYFVNAFTVYRLAASFLLIFLAVVKNIDLFKWLLALSFFTDMVDGFLARKFKVASVMGAKIDSIADDLTILAALVGLIILKPDFIHAQLFILSILLSLFFVQTFFALWRYGKISSFHTYLAKCAALLQGSFLILLFFLPYWPLQLFYAAAIVTFMELVEEIIIVSILREYKTNVKGLFWVLKKKLKTGAEI